MSRFVNFREIVMSISPSFSISTYHEYFINEDLKIRKQPFKGIITDKIIIGGFFEILVVDI